MSISTRAPVALLTLALASCAGNQVTSRGPSAAPSVPRATSGGAQDGAAVAAQDDVTEVAAPAELVALFRSTSVRALVARVARFGVVTEAQAIDAVTEVLSGQLGGPGLGRLVHMDRPIDGAVMFSGGRPAFVISLAVPEPGEVLRRLGATVRPVSLGNGVFELATPESSSQQPTDDERASDRDERSERPTCFVSPTPNAREGRLTCAIGARPALEGATPFLARTLPRRPVGQEGIVATVFPSALRTLAGQDAQRGIDELDREIDRDLSRTTTGPLARPEVRQPFVRLLHDLAANVRALTNETTALDLAVDFDDRGLRLRGSVDVRNPTGSLVRGLIDGTRQAPPLPSQNLQRIPADAAAVVGGSLGRQAWASQTAGMIELLAALARTEARLPAAQVAQLQEILASTTSMDLSGVSASAMDPQGRPSGVALLRAADEARANALVTNLRRLMAIVRTPSFTRAIDRLLRDADVTTRVPWAQFRELPTTGLPAGSYALQLPDFAALANEARSSSSAVTPAPRTAQRGRGPGASARIQQYIMIPEGSQVTVLVGADARALWTATNARTGAPLDPAARGIRPGALTLSISPAGVADTMAANPETAAGSAEVRRLLAALPDRGTTPILFRMSNAEVEGAQRFSLEIDVPTSTLSLLASGSQRLFRP